MHGLRRLVVSRRLSSFVVVVASQICCHWGKLLQVSLHGGVACQFAPLFHCDLHDKDMSRKKRDAFRCAGAAFCEILRLRAWCAFVAAMLVVNIRRKLGRSEKLPTKTNRNRRNAPIAVPALLQRGAPHLRQGILSDFALNSQQMLGCGLGYWKGELHFRKICGFHFGVQFQQNRLATERLQFKNMCGHVFPKTRQYCPAHCLLCALLTLRVCNNSLLQIGFTSVSLRLTRVTHLNLACGFVLCFGVVVFLFSVVGFLFGFWFACFCPFLAGE